MVPKVLSISELTAAVGASPGRGRGNGTVLAMANSQVARREIKVARVLSRMADHHGGRQPHTSTWPRRICGANYLLHPRRGALVAICLTAWVYSHGWNDASSNAGKQSRLNFCIFETALRCFTRPGNPMSVRRVPVRKSKEKRG